MTDHPTISFSLFILSLAASAEIHLGSLPEPGTDKPGAPNLTEASHLIEVIAMLKAKTAGNLDEQEARLVDSVLYDLRIRYVEAARRDASTPASAEAAAGPRHGASREGGKARATPDSGAGEVRAAPDGSTAEPRAESEGKAE